MQRQQVEEPNEVINSFQLFWVKMKQHSPDEWMDGLLDGLLQ